MKLRQEITQSRFAIETAEIERGVFAVIEDLFPRAEMPIQSLGQLRFVEKRGYWSKHNVADLAAICERNVRRIENRTR